MEILGTKYQTYIDDELVIFRLCNIKSEDKFVLEDTDNNKVSMTKEELSKCIKLENDALLNIMTTSNEDGYDDVYACVNRIEDIKQGNNIPALILRQGIYSKSKNSFGLGDDIYVGECVDINHCQDEAIESLLEYTEIKDTLSIALYVDDKFSDISKFIISHNAKKINNKLAELKSTYGNAVKGYCNTLKELFEENNFMMHYRSIFNIMQVDFPIELDNNVSNDGVITLNNKQINRLEDILFSYITNVSVLKYDKDIDVSKIVDHTHIMVSDKTENIYLISYVVSGAYKVDDDIAAAMNV